MNNALNGQRSCFMLVAVAVGVLIFYGCTPGQPGELSRMLDRSSITMNFFINETGMPLDGELSINDQFLGNTTNGTIIVGKKLLAPGTFTLSGSDDAGDYKFYFEFSTSDIRFDRISFQVP